MRNWPSLVAHMGSRYGGNVTTEKLKHLFLSLCLKYKSLFLDWFTLLNDII